MNFFKAKSRSPADLVRSTREGLLKLDSGPAEARKRSNEEVSRNLSQMKALLTGDGDPQPELLAQLATETYTSSLLLLLLTHMSSLEFEARKDVSQIFNNLLRRQIGSRWPTVDYLAGKEGREVVWATLRGYEDEDVALNTGMILKEMVRHEPLCEIILYSDELYAFPHYIEDTKFGVSCDAFSNFKELLTRHKPLVSTFLEAHYDRFFTMYASLTSSANYVTKRQSLKLLGEILLDRANFNVMTRYIADEGNLKAIMILLRDKSRNIQFEAFHVFKVFVANPKKPAQVEAILRRNKEKLLSFLKNFHNDKEDEQFTDEKQFLIAQIQGL